MIDDLEADRPREILVLGGTAWVSGAVAQIALAQGHRITCLARGRSGDVPDGATLVPGDRADPVAYEPLTDRVWDLVVDVSRQPLHVATAVSTLADRARHWVFVSTASVYADDTVPGQDESAAVHEPWSGSGLAPPEAYGQAKVACERVLLDAVPGALVARAGLIVGYGDRSDRFGYWPARFARATDDELVLVPPASDPCQVIDVADLVAWLLRCGLRGEGGVMNAVGPVRSLGDVVQAAQCVTGSRARPVVASGTWLEDQGVEPWMGPESLPLWLPMPEYAGHPTRDRSRAVAAGLGARPLEETVADALRWEQELGLDRARAAGLSLAREQELLALLS